MHDKHHRAYEPIEVEGFFRVDHYLIYVGVMLGIGRWIALQFGADDPLPDTSLGAALEAILQGLRSHLAAAIAIFAVCVGGTLSAAGAGEIEWPSASRRNGRDPSADSPPPLNTDARMAEARLSRVIARINAMPADLREEASIELGGIEERHLPALRNAHRKARATVSPASPQAEALDNNYAASIDRMSATLEELAARSEELGRERLAWQTLVIEERFPATSREAD
ncbi:hypothetical protein [Sphingomonas sp. BK235]|uniref:hypothetical protein n=1 Tax=Sphingomonas sp. BK235 TaxID=2512131 RepID=UPI0010487682|nr:hypothetical protein [Sphingomonas sp. BK235]